MDRTRSAEGIRKLSVSRSSSVGVPTSTTHHGSGLFSVASGGRRWGLASRCKVCIEMSGERRELWRLIGDHLPRRTVIYPLRRTKSTDVIIDHHASCIIPHMSLHHSRCSDLIPNFCHGVCNPKSVLVVLHTVTVTPNPVELNCAPQAVYDASESLVISSLTTVNTRSG